MRHGNGNDRRWSFAAALAAVSILTAPAWGAPPPGEPEGAFKQRDVWVFEGAQSGGGSLFGGGYLGLETSDLTPELREYFGVDRSRGVLVSRVTPDGPAERAGIEVGDVITGFSGRAVTTTWMLTAAVRSQSGEEPVTVELRRGDRSLALPVNLEQRQREAFDIGAFFRWEADGDDGSHVLRLEIPAEEGGAHAPGRILELLGDGIEDIDWTELSRRFSFESHEGEDLEERLKVLEERLHEIEVEIKARNEDDP